jgi:hypothetical protein
MSEAGNPFAPPRASVEVREGPNELWAMPFKELRKIYHASHTFRALGFLYGLVAIGCGAVMTMFGFNAHGADMTLLILFVIVLATAAASVTSYTRQEWGRGLGGFLCILMLFMIPIGTVIGILGLVAYFQAGKLFGAGRLEHGDVILVYRQRKDES